MDHEGNRTMFLSQPPSSEAVDAVYADDREADGYVSNLTRLWCWRPDMFASFAALRAGLMDPSALTDRDRAVLVTATAANAATPIVRWPGGRAWPSSATTVPRHSSSVG